MLIVGLLVGIWFAASFPLALVVGKYLRGRAPRPLPQRVVTVHRVPARSLVASSR